MNTEREYTRAELALIEKHREHMCEDSSWYEYTYTDFDEQVKLFTAIEPRDKHFRLAYSQGDGASIDADNAPTLLDMLDAATAALTALDANPEETATDPIKSACVDFARNLLGTYERFRLLGGNVLQCVALKITRPREWTHAEWLAEYDTDEMQVAADEAGLTAALDDKDIDERVERLCRALYRALRDEYEYQTSDEAVWEMLVANDIKPDPEDDEEDDERIAA